MFLSLIAFAVVACIAAVQGDECFDLAEAHKNLLSIHEACRKESEGAGGDKKVCYDKYRECCLIKMKAWDDGSKCVNHDNFIEILKKYASDDLKGKLSSDVAHCKDKCSGSGDKITLYYDCLEEKLAADCAGVSGFRQEFHKEFNAAAEDICK